MSYYGRPVLKRPVWKWLIPAYFFTGGVAAGSSLLAFGARRTGRRRLARRARLTSLAAITASAGFLVEDLGRPERFANMLRVVRPTSPMSVGSWVLAAYGPAVGLAAVRRDGVAAADTAAAVLAPVVATYTGVLLADTAVPAWRDARGTLPLLFASGAAASAGGLAVVLAPSEESGPARRLALVGAAAEVAASGAMKRGLGPVGAVYDEGRAHAFAVAARRLTLAGMACTGLGGRRLRRAGGLLLAAGAAAERFAVFHAGVQSTEDPRLAG
ncbi:MAG TPA: NrfD/PsrC family molybdoenzyme membrane anchor subunit [Acidimicrobiales bacterium]|nr:NrfD/PsrC family molybdoenzyme membrane anchor subunit [Acidimicrobiales bacterium]